jgi:Xaa-Pro aminopeptidase
VSSSHGVDVDPAVFARRRQRLLEALGDGLLLLPTAPHQLRNGDVHHPYRAGSDFWYLTGFPEPDAVLAAWREGRGSHQAVLFVRPRDKTREIWDGRRHGPRGAIKTFGVDGAHPIGELLEKLPELLKPHARLFHTLGADPVFDEGLFKVFARTRLEQRRQNPPAHPAIVDPRPALAEQRVVKDSHEIATLERAADVTAEAHRAAMRAARPGMAEFELQAEIERVFRSHGSPRNGYESIVASGANACILHYVENRRVLRRGDLVLVDAGAETGHYTADITRTWPVDGEFTPAQRAVYEVVLRAQKAAIRAVRPGAPWDAPHRASLREVTRGLVALGVLRGSVAGLVKKGKCRKWFMHGTSHWLGMDVHDAGPYQGVDGKPVRLRPGMVLTVEPGLYFDPHDRSVRKELRGIGVRIEDDVLVTRGGNRVLTAGVPKEVGEIEELCRRG